MSEKLIKYHNSGLPRILFAMAVAVLFMAVPKAAHAQECVMNGIAYPPGTVIGSLVCDNNGRWKVR